MKILYHHRIGSKDGQYVHIEELVGALRMAGHQVLVVGPANFDSQDFGGESGLVTRLRQSIPGAVYEMLETGYNAIDYRRLSAAIKRFQPDVIYERYNLYLLSGVAARRRFAIPLLLEVNAPLFSERSAYGGLHLGRWARLAESLAWRGADHVFSVTEVLARQVVARGVPRSRVSVTPNGINLDLFPETTSSDQPKKKLGLCGDGTTVLGFVGFAREWHGLDAVVDLLAEYRDQLDLHFLLVGDGPACDALRAKAQTAGVAECMTITGVVGRDDVARYVAAFDIAMLPSVVAYASPLKLFEYMACRKAIVAPRTPNIEEILTDEKDAVLFDVGAREGFKSAVRSLLTDSQRRQRLAAGALSTLTDRDLTWRSNANRVVEVAQALVSSGSKDG